MIVFDIINVLAWTATHFYNYSINCRGIGVIIFVLDIIYIVLCIYEDANRISIEKTVKFKMFNIEKKETPMRKKTTQDSMRRLILIFNLSKSLIRQPTVATFPIR